MTQETSQQALIERFPFHNPWWTTGRVPESFLPAFERPILTSLLSNLEKTKRILIIKGPRRTGKTTLVCQIINHLLEKNVSPKNIFYLSFDDISLRVPPDEILSAYEIVRSKNLREIPSFIFWDEVQFLPNWELTIKLYFDRKFPIKFIASGSSASLLTQTLESLAGRTIEEVILPFSFAEKVLYSTKNPNLKKYISDQKQTDFFSPPPPEISLFNKELKLAWELFLADGGFPHLLAEPKELHQKLLSEDVIQKVIYRDLVELYNIRQPSLLEKLFAYMGKNTAQVVNLTTISQNLGLSRPAVENYLSYLERAYLLFRLPKFSKSSKEILRANPKSHCIDVKLAQIFSAERAKIVETAVVSHFFASSSKNLYFWRNRNEVDLVLAKEGSLIPIEIKDSAESKIPTGLAYFMRKYKIKNGLVLYNGDFIVEKKDNLAVTFYPFWQFLLQKI